MLGFVLLLNGIATAQQNRLAPEEKSAGFELLFDGESTSGWLEITGDGFPAESWKVEDGTLKTVAGLPGFQDIRTVMEVRDFELRFSWRIAKGGNSGVKYRLEEVDRWQAKDGRSYHARARGLEYQLVDDALNAEARSDPKNTAGALYGKVAPREAAARPAGEWNESRIVVRGRHVEHWLNGKRVVDCECAAAEGRATPVALQNHNAEAWFRDLRIRRLAGN